MAIMLTRLNICLMRIKGSKAKTVTKQTHWNSIIALNQSRPVFKLEITLYTVLLH
jgi:hypothetical protein